jgi:RNA polymerase sigma-70 factor (ECF subfamily)
MNRFEQKSYRQIHAELGIALQTVDYHMMKALALLRAELNDRY